MKKVLAVVLLVLAFSTITWPAREGERRVCFTPGDDCTAFIVTQIAKARSELLVMAYFFTDEKIVRAICDAKERHVAVSVLLDRANEQDRFEATTKKLGICAHVSVDDKAMLQHNKVLVIDGTRVINGSFNLSASAQRNAENLLLTEDRETAGEYSNYFHERAEHARPLREMHPDIEGLLSSDPAVAMNAR